LTVADVDVRGMGLVRERTSPGAARSAAFR
jgi:hypothetical protein